MLGFAAAPETSPGLRSPAAEKTPGRLEVAVADGPLVVVARDDEGPGIADMAPASSELPQSSRSSRASTHYRC